MAFGYSTGLGASVLKEAGEIKHPYHDLNSREAEWIEHRDWVYNLDFLSASHSVRNNPARRHHGGDWWDHQAVIEGLFGPVEDGVQFILASQWLQAEGLRYAVEASRRRWPHTAGVFFWQLNEPWPLAVCTSAVEYTGQPKLAYYAVKQTYWPRLATVRYAGLKLAESGLLQAELWFSNALEAVSGKLRVDLNELNGQPLAGSNTCEFYASANSSLKLASLDLDLPPGFSGIMVLTLSWPEGYNR